MKEYLGPEITKNKTNLDEGSLESFGFKIELAKPEDWEEVKKIRIEAIKNETSSFDVSYESIEKMTDKKWKNLLKNKDMFFYLIKKGNSAAGMTMAEKRDIKVFDSFSKRYFYNGEKVEDVWISQWTYVKPEVRGFASVKMLDSVFEEIKKRKGVDFACLVVLKQNPNLEAIRKMTEKYGFQEDDNFLKSGNPFFIAKISEMKKIFNKRDAR